MDLKFIQDYQKIIVSGIIGLSIICASSIASGAIVKYQKLQNQTITVTGSAQAEIYSDFAVLTVGYKTQAKTLQEGYKKMNAYKDVIVKYLVDQKVRRDQIQIMPISSYEVYRRVGDYVTNDVDFYRFNAEIKVATENVKLVEELTKRTGEIVDKGIDINYSNAEYLISNSMLDEAKIRLVGEATANAKNRASSMVFHTKNKIGTLTSAKTGVFQIVPVNSTEVTDYGINDTSSIHKKIIAVVNATFSVK